MRNACSKQCMALQPEAGFHGATNRADKACFPDGTPLGAEFGDSKRRQSAKCSGEMFAGGGESSGHTWPCRRCPFLTPEADRATEAMHRLCHLGADDWGRQLAVTMAYRSEHMAGTAQCAGPGSGKGRWKTWLSDRDTQQAMHNVQLEEVSLRNLVGSQCQG